MAFIWRRRSTSIVKIVAILTAIWFFVAFIIYTDDTRRESASNKWNAMSMSLKGIAGGGSALGEQLPEAAGYEGGAGYGVNNKNIIDGGAIDAQKRDNAEDAIDDDDAGGAARPMPPMPQQDEDDVADLNEGDESILNNVIVHPIEKKVHGGKLIADV